MAENIGNLLNKFDIEKVCPENQFVSDLILVKQKDWSNRQVINLKKFKNLSSIIISKWRAFSRKRHSKASWKLRGNSTPPSYSDYSSASPRLCNKSRKVGNDFHTIVRVPRHDHKLKRHDYFTSSEKISENQHTFI